MFRLSANSRLQRQLQRNLTLYGGPSPLSLGLYDVLRRPPEARPPGALVQLWQRFLRLFSPGGKLRL